MFYRAKTKFLEVRILIWGPGIQRKVMENHERCFKTDLGLGYAFVL